MAMTLLEASKINEADVLRAGVIEEYARSSDILMALPFETIAGNAYKYNREDTLPGVGFRGVNEGYSESVGVINPQTESLVIAGGDLDVDKFILETNGAGVRSTHEMMKAKALSLRWTKEFIKGDSTTDPRVLDGLQVRVTGTQLKDAGATSGGDALSLGALDDLIDLVDNPTHLIVNKKIRNLLTAAGRNTSVGGYVVQSPDAFGRLQTTYQGLPLLICDYDNDGNQILPFTEANPGGGAAASTSIYCVSMGNGMLMGLQSAGGIQVRDLGELETKPVMRTRVEWYSTFAVMHGRAVARLRGIKNAAIVA